MHLYVTVTAVANRFVGGVQRPLPRFTGYCLGNKTEGSIECCFCVRIIFPIRSYDNGAKQWREEIAECTESCFGRRSQPGAILGGFVLQWVWLMSSISRITGLVRVRRESNVEDMAIRRTTFIQNLADTEASDCALSSESAAECLNE